MGAGSEGFSAPIPARGNLRLSGPLLISLVVALAIAGSAIATGLFDLLPAGHLTRHMALHIFLMNLLAPALAFAIVRWGGHVRLKTVAPLLLAACLQMAVLWAWHAPQALPATMQFPPLHFAMAASLLLVALFFWLAILRQDKDRRLASIISLMITGKLFCLLGILLVFAPRTLYEFSHHTDTGLADQQLAGLLMIVACPLIYVTCGLWIAARWFNDLGNRPAAQYSAGPGR